MGDISSSVTKTEAVPNLGAKLLVVETPNTADSGDTIDIDLSDHGCTEFLGIIGNEHTTEGEIVTTEDPTTSKSGTTITITIGGSSDNNEKRVYWVLMK
ncbi:MAG: hypothetical protein ACOC5T_04215 [Elusimicrobiota bacterium]